MTDVDLGLDRRTSLTEALKADNMRLRATVERVRELLPKPADVDHRFDDGDNLLVRVGDLRAALDGGK